MTPEHHRLLLYSSVREMLMAVVPFLRDGLTLGETVIVALDPDEERHVLAALGPAASRVRAVQAVAYPSPEAAVEAMRGLISAPLAAGAPGVRIAGSLPEGFSRDWHLWARYEREIDAVLRELPAMALCVYDSAKLSPAVTQHVLELHPGLAWPFGLVEPNPGYLGP